VQLKVKTRAQTQFPHLPISFIQNFQFYSIKKTPGPMIGLGNLDANLEGYFMYLFL